MSDLDAKSRALLEKDSGNPNGGNVSTSSGKPASGPSGGRSALKEAIAARRKAMPSPRPDSAQSTLSDIQVSEPAPKSSTRTVPTGAPLSSLSSAPMRPGMKPRRAELSRPATADPYARRPDSRTESRAQSGRQVGSPSSVRSKAATPSSKPINAPRLRPHEAGQTGTTRGKPKKLDLSKSKSHGDLAAASRARGEFPDGLGNQSSHGNQGEPNSPAPIVLESPPLAASQPQLAHDAQPESGHDGVPEPFEEPQPMSLGENVIAAVSPRARRREPGMSSPSRHVDLVVDPEASPSPKAQPDDMVIYEDPATPVTAETEAPKIDPVEHFTPTKSPRRVDRQDSGEETGVDTPVTSTTPVKHTPVVPPPGPLTDTPNELPFQSPARRTPLRGSPSPTRNRPQPTPSDQTPDVDSVLPRESSTAPSHKSPTDENAHMTKAPELAATPRSAAKPSVLEEVPLNESPSRTAETRQRSLESLTPSADEEPSRRSRKWAERHRSPSPRSKDPANAREMIHKAPSRIASKTMDISGFRKLQGLFQYHGEELVTREQDYYAMLQVLLTELEAAPTNRKDHDVKTQILATIRSMLLRTSKLFHRYDIPAMAAIIRARRHYESNSHFVTCLEEVVEQLVELIPPPTVISGVLQGLDLGEEPEEDVYRTIILGLSAIHQALSPGSVEISDEVLARVGTVVSQQLGHPRPGVRKQATELCTLLNLKFGLDRVQKITPPAGEGSLNLLTYFMARRSQ